jgi:hypothetical protein
VTDISRVFHAIRFISFTIFNVVLFQGSYGLVIDVRVSLSLHALREHYLGVVLLKFGVILEDALGLHDSKVQ